MVKYFNHKGKMYKAVLWTASRTMGFSVSPWPDFEWSQVGVFQVKHIFHEEFKKEKVHNIDFYINRWKRNN